MKTLHKLTIGGCLAFAVLFTLYMRSDDPPPSCPYPPPACPGFVQK